MGWLGKTVVAAFGLVVLLAGLSLVSKPAVDWIVTVALVVSAAILYGIVGWKTLLNGKFETEDLVSVITLILAVITTIAAISSIIFFQFNLPPWMTTITAWIVVIVGLYTIAMGLFTKTDN
jgi:hypothetical protein